MATVTTTHTTAPALPGGFLSRAFNAVTIWYDARETRKALSGLSNRELDDIGLSRSDIEGIVSQGMRR